MKKILLLIAFLIFLPNLSKAEKVKLLICESIYNKNLDLEIWKTENNLLSQFFIKLLIINKKLYILVRWF